MPRSILLTGLALPLLLLTSCWGERQTAVEDPKPDEKPAQSMAQKRSLDPVSTPIYAGEDAKARIVKASVTKAIADFQVAEGRNPSSIQELVDKKYLPQLPKEPVGYTYNYDLATGQFDVVLKP